MTWRCNYRCPCSGELRPRQGADPRCPNRSGKQFRLELVEAPLNNTTCSSPTYDEAPASPSSTARRRRPRLSRRRGGEHSPSLGPFPVQGSRVFLWTMEGRGDPAARVLWMGAAITSSSWIYGGCNHPRRDSRWEEKQ